GLDLSYTRTGVCVWDGVQAQIAAISSDPKKSYIERAQTIREAIAVLVEKHRPQVFCIESPLSHAHRAEILTGLFFIVLDRLHQGMREYPQTEGIIVLSNPSLRKLMGVKQGRGSKALVTKTEFKKRIVAMAVELAGPRAPTFSHDEADAFHLAHCALRFWTDWKRPGGSLTLTKEEQEVWYSEEKVALRKKKSAKARKSKTKESPSKRKGVIYRQGEFLFLPEKGV
ncbi:MAG: hypothetical protein Q8P59_03010, partial [Dehalococcoidia bacterium]|nr:hypothetical protein [Dehalococcoidia bacterium]